MSSTLFETIMDRAEPGVIAAYEQAEAEAVADGLTQRQAQRMFELAFATLAWMYQNDRTLYDRFVDGTFPADQFRAILRDSVTAELNGLGSW